MSRIKAATVICVALLTGATGNIGLERVANAAPDGYTLSQASAADTAIKR